MTPEGAGEDAARSGAGVRKLASAAWRPTPRKQACALQPAKDTRERAETRPYDAGPLSTRSSFLPSSGMEEFCPRMTSHLQQGRFWDSF